MGQDKLEALPEPPFKPGLIGPRAIYKRMSPDTTLLQFLKHMRGYFKSVYQMSKYIGLSNGSVTHVLNGAIEDSPTLRKQLGINKHPTCWRVRVRVSEAFYKRWKASCDEYGLTPRELIKDSLDVYDDVMENLP